MPIEVQLLGHSLDGRAASGRIHGSFARVSAGTMDYWKIPSGWPRGPLQSPLRSDLMFFVKKALGPEPN